MPRISSIIEQRNRYIENYIRKAEKLQEQALISLEKYDLAIENAKNQAEIKSLEAKKELEDFVRQKSEETSSELNKKIAESELMLAKERAVALEEAAKAAAVLSRIILKKIGLDDLLEKKTENADNGR